MPCVSAAAASECWSERVCLCQYFQAVAAEARHPSLCAEGRGVLFGAVADGSQFSCSGDSCRSSPVSPCYCTGRMRGSWHRGETVGFCWWQLSTWVPASLLLILVWVAVPTSAEVCERGALLALWAFNVRSRLYTRNVWLYEEIQRTWVQFVWHFVSWCFSTDKLSNYAWWVSENFFFLTPKLVLGR